MEDDFDPKKVEKIQSNDCNLCKASFGWFKSKKLKMTKKYCAKCGHNVCNQCLEPNKVKLVTSDVAPTYKVCSSCYAKSQNQEIMLFYRGILLKR